MNAQPSLGAPSVRKPYNDCAGYKCSARTGKGRGWVVVYKAADQGLDTEDGPWVTVCETHHTLVNSTSEKNARAVMKDPQSFCEDCRDEGGAA